MNNEDGIITHKYSINGFDSFGLELEPRTFSGAYLHNAISFTENEFAHDKNYTKMELWRQDGTYVWTCILTLERDKEPVNHTGAVYPRMSIQPQYAAMPSKFFVVVEDHSVFGPETRPVCQAFINGIKYALDAKLKGRW